jgi:UDP-N-acetylmuramyl pentapeptide phosphotransferase/UDP-N-acetylglucosamine-1-phosphate transferase
MLWVVPLISFVISLAGTRAALEYLRRKAILDTPNHRSSHANPTPRGAGLAVTPVLLGAWAFLYPVSQVWMLCACGFVLAGVSWIDDVRGVSPAVRLSVQAGMTAVMLGAGGLSGPVFGGWLPEPLDAVAAGVLWIWFVNLFNFMDGSDGITGVETVVIGLGVAAVAWDSATPSLAPLGLAAAAVMVGFLAWNWHPARIFLGDVGSVPVGFAIGWLLLELAARGQWAPALILPLYYLSDATITLVRRAARGDAVWLAHREHFYQRAIQRGLGHRGVALAVLACGAVLVLAALWAAAAGPWRPLAVAALSVVFLCAFFAGQSHRKG